MTQGERVKAVRKSKEVNLTLEKFGEKLGVTKQTISRIENGVNNLTDQMKKSICREFGVDYIWLDTGEGEMFIKTAEANSIDNSLYNILFKLLSFSDESDIKAVLATISGRLLSKNKLSIDELEEIVRNIKED